MGKSKKRLVLTAAKVMPAYSEKVIVTDEFSNIIADFKQKFIPEKPNKDSSYLIDIYTTWWRNFFYLCEKYKAEFPNRIADEYERKFVRLAYVGKDQFNFSYFRHTGAWHVVAESISLSACKELLLSNPVFQPSPIV